jgi:tetratricopeptide (TPR) repeat protein
MRHVTDADMEQLLSGRLGPAETRSLFLHLTSRCRFCRRHWALIADLLEEGDAPGLGAAVDDSIYDAAIDRAFAAAKASLPHWQEEAARVARNLAEAPKYPRGILDLPKDTPVEYGWSWVETLLRAIPAERYRDPQQMLILALATEAQARRLGENGRYPPALAADLHARTLGELANAYRINNQFGEASSLLDDAVVEQQKGTGDPLVLARLWEIGSSVRLAQRRLDIAIEALDGACQLYAEVGEPHLAGRALINKGICTAHTCRYAEAAQILQKGLDQIDAARDPQLAMTGRYCYIYSLADCEEYRKAGRHLLESGLREAFAGEPLNLLKLRWLEGKIHAGLGRLRKAETAFTAARQGFFEKIQHYDAALVGLELLGVWLRQGKAVEAQELAEDVLETFLGLGIQSEALKALRYLHEACRQRAATPILVKQVADFLRQVEWQPLLRFAPAAGL